jgi:(2Fe-2S) ferredoxin
MSLRSHYLFVCNNRRPDGAPKTSCQAQGAEEVFAALKQGIAAAGLAGRTVRCVQTGCLDFCGNGPTVLLEPNHCVYGHVTVADVPDIIEGLKTDTLVERLLLAPIPSSD